MIFAFGFLSFVCALISAAYLQIPTFVLATGYRWFHAYKTKRWIFRILSVILFALFCWSQPSVTGLLLTGFPVLFFLFFSLINANPRVYIALTESQILKSRHNDYPAETEILGYTDESGNAIAYPLDTLIKPRHILNDTLLKNPLLVSYCMACRSAMVYFPVINGIRLHFEVLGVYRRNMIMRDIETGTVWQQGTGEAVYGKLYGNALTLLPYQQMVLKNWLLLYPHSLIASEADSVKDGLFSKERLMKMMKITEKLVAPGLTDLGGLPLREPVFGVQAGKYAKAYPVSMLKKQISTFTDLIGDTKVIVEYNMQTNHISVKEAVGGKQLVAQSHWWFGWKEFHPDTEIWRGLYAINDSA